MKSINEPITSTSQEYACTVNGTPHTYPKATSSQYPVWRKNQGEIKQVFVTGDPGADGSPLAGWAAPDAKLM